MALDRDFAEAIIGSMSNNGWIATIPEGDLSNPLHITFTQENQSLPLIMYARRLTPQASATSTHNRPVGEMHMQMIFDNSRRGAGIRNYLEFAPTILTVLLGFYVIESEYVIAAYDPNRHREYAYSKSLQVKAQTLQDASQLGMVFQPRTNGEIIVAFHVNEFDQYLEHADEWHSLSPASIEDMRQEAPLTIQSAFEQVESTQPPPLLVAEERKQRTQEITRYIRNYKFTEGIKRIYERCAICGFQYDEVLDAAHIVPVVEGGTDTYDNGLGLCPNCHRMFDRGLVLVNEEGNIYLNPHLAEHYEDIGRADSLEHLRNILRERLWLPADEQYHPSAANLKRTFTARNKSKPDF